MMRKRVEAVSGQISFTCQGPIRELELDSAYGQTVKWRLISAKTNRGQNTDTAGSMKRSRAPHTRRDVKARLLA